MIIDLVQPHGALAPWREALETQLLAHKLVRRLLAHPDGKIAEFRPMWQVDEALLKHATPFAWSRDPIQATRQASASIPLDAQMNPWNIDSAAVWWHFEEPLPFQTISDATAPIVALNMGWIAAHRKSMRFPAGTPTDVVEHALRNGPPVDAELVIAAWIRDPLRQFSVIPTQTIRWPEGETLQEMLEANRARHVRAYGPGGQWEKAEQIGLESFMVTTENIARFILAGFAWLQQRVLVEQSGAIERHRRKEFKRMTSREVKDIRIVSLRRTDRPEHEPTGTHEETLKREWSCRWTVDGHFRNQACGPNRTERRLTWIGPYVKGPDSKPLKPTARKVYAVNR